MMLRLTWTTHLYASTVGVMAEEPTPGALLRAARQRADLSIREAAKSAGVSEGLWRQTELGHRNVGNGISVPVHTGPAKLRNMAEAVGADVAAVLRAAGHDESAGTNGPRRPVPSPWEPPDQAHKMTPRQRRVVESVILALTDDREADESNEKEIVPVETGLPATVTALVDDVDARRGDIEQIVARVLREMAEEGRQTGR